MRQCTGQKAPIRIAMDQYFVPPVGRLAIQSGPAGFQQTAGERNADEGRGIVSPTFHRKCT